MINKFSACGKPGEGEAYQTNIWLWRILFAVSCKLIIPHSGVLIRSWQTPSAKLTDGDLVRCELPSRAKAGKRIILVHTRIFYWVLCCIYFLVERSSMPGLLTRSVICLGVRSAIRSIILLALLLPSNSCALTTAHPLVIHRREGDRIHQASVVSDCFF